MAFAPQETEPELLTDNRFCARGLLCGDKHVFRIQVDDEDAHEGNVGLTCTRGCAEKHVLGGVESGIYHARLYTVQRLDPRESGCGPLWQLLDVY